MTYYPSDPENGLVHRSSATALSLKRNIPKGSKYRIVLNHRGKYLVERRVLWFFWDVMHWVDQDGVEFDEFETEYRAIRTLQKVLDRSSRAGVVAYLNEDGDIT